MDGWSKARRIIGKHYNGSTSYPEKLLSTRRIVQQPPQIKHISIHSLHFEARASPTSFIRYQLQKVLVPLREAKGRLQFTNYILLSPSPSSLDNIHSCDEAHFLLSGHVNVKILDIMNRIHMLCGNIQEVQQRWLVHAGKLWHHWTLLLWRSARPNWARQLDLTNLWVSTRWCSSLYSKGCTKSPTRLISPTHHLQLSSQLMAFSITSFKVFSG